ncbi:hypothetical protein OBBRIDRAFT_505952 [Obba rivulosa]|uniref:Uncharacterized protein n=1 Tax=Obba rivulosa TaxID=1052685 RepID=A0A8E2B3U2_9APHY|nr:hypothetical protein OBBRIDRAFT_505952 [Obba rivulosa]
MDGPDLSSSSSIAVRHRMSNRGVMQGADVYGRARRLPDAACYSLPRLVSRKTPMLKHTHRAGMTYPSIGPDQGTPSLEMRICHVVLGAPSCGFTHMCADWCRVSHRATRPCTRVEAIMPPYIGTQDPEITAGGTAQQLRCRSAPGRLPSKRRADVFHEVINAPANQAVLRCSVLALAVLRICETLALYLAICFAASPSMRGSPRCRLDQITPRFAVHSVSHDYNSCGYMYVDGNRAARPSV